MAENKEVLKRPLKATAKKDPRGEEIEEKESYAREIHGVLQHTWPGTGVSEPTMEILNSFVHDLFERIAGEASNFLSILCIH